ncbi:MAG TPA: hypothetical protein VFN03_08695, partial [Trueperaceae bacterium]|nr:hypothetical protein [Trueperaceae bacterium]
MRTGLLAGAATLLTQVRRLLPTSALAQAVGEPAGEHAGHVGPAGTSLAADHAHHGGMVTVGEVDHARNGFDPLNILTDFDGGRVSTMADGRTLREYVITALDKEIEVAPGLFFPAWTYNGRVP